MAATHDAGSGDPQRPYTLGAFQSKLNKFQDLIRDITYQGVEATPEERRQWITENLRYDQFCEKIRELFGSEIKNQDLKSVYRKISTNPDAKVDWSELFGYFQTGAEDEEITVGEEVSIFMVSKRRRVGEAAGDRKRRDSVQHLKYISSLDCYIAASQKGALSVWTSKLRLQACVDINEQAWVTGCDYLPGIRRVACCTERSIAIWDIRAKGSSQNIFTIKPIEHSPQCMTYVPGPHASLEDIILFGDDQGYVNVLTLVAKDLTMKNSKDDRRASQNVAIDPSKLSFPIVRRKIHGDWVLKIKYFSELRCFASCSPSSTQSFVLEEPERLHDNGDLIKLEKGPTHDSHFVLYALGRLHISGEVRGVSIPKGVNCFDYCARANIIATGGVDKIIRVWHPHIFSRPTGKLMGHLFTVTDIACNERDQHIISLSTARVFRVWDIHTLTCLQVFTDNEERPGEKRIYSILFDNKHDRLLTGSSVIDAWPLTRAVQDTMQVPHTHDRPIVQILTNKELNQIVSVCTESVIKVWEMDSGKLVYSIPDAHGSNIEVTVITLDRSGYRLASGAFDGSVKVWDFGAGQVIKSKSGRGADEDLSITGLIYQDFHEDHVIVASGWTNKIRLFLDSSDNNDLTLLREFVDVYYWTRDVSLSPTGTNTPSALSGASPLPDIGQPNAHVTSIFRKDYLLTNHEVTCMTSVSPDIMATGCSSGNVILWHIESSKVDRIFMLPPPEALSAKSRHRIRQSGERRVNSICVLVHKVRRLDPAYIKKLTGMRRAEGSERVNEDVAVSSPSPSHHSKMATISVAQGQEEQPPEESKHQLQEAPANVEKSNTLGTGNAADPAIPITSNLLPADDEKLEDKNEEMKNEEKTNAVEGEDPDETEAIGGEEIDPDAKMIVNTFEPVLATVHQDGFVRFWDLETGEILREISPLTRRQGVPVTSICYDSDVNFIVIGDNKGYLTLWDVKAFMEDKFSHESDALKQVVSWRAHLTRVVSLAYSDSMQAILSASTDGSVRVWWGTKGRFVGFFGQHRPFHFPASEETASPPVLPYDITEGPLAPLKRKSATQKIRTVQKFEYPLVFDQQRWEPFRHSAYKAHRDDVMKPEDKKFFAALIKPKAYNTHLESFITGEKKSGAVFRALPVYRVKTPKRLKTPESSYRTEDDDEENMYRSSSIFGTVPGMKTAPVKTGNNGRRSQYAKPLPIMAPNGTGLSFGTASSFSPKPRRRPSKSLL